VSDTVSPSTLVGELHVLRLEVAVDDALLVRRLERLGDLARDRQALVERQHSPLAPLGERRPEDELHDEGLRVSLRFEPVDLRDVRVVELGQQLGLALETGQALGVRGEGRGKELECHVAPELRVARAIHFAHSASTELGGHSIMSERGADHSRPPPGSRSARRRGDEDTSRDGRSFGSGRVDATADSPIIAPR